MMFRRRVDPPVRLPDPGEILAVRAYEGYRPAEEPRAIVVDGAELAIDEICWRASVADGGRRLRAFVVRAGGAKMRISYDEDTGMWTLERHLPG